MANLKNLINLALNKETASEVADTGNEQANTSLTFNVLDHIRQSLGITKKSITKKSITKKTVELADIFIKMEVSNEEEVFILEDFEALVSVLPHFIKAPYVKASIMKVPFNLLIKEDISILFIDVSLDDQKTWKNGKLANSRYFRFSVNQNGRLQRVTPTNSFIKLGKCQSEADIIKKINKVISSEAANTEESSSELSVSEKAIFSKKDLDTLGKMIKDDYPSLKVQLLQEKTKEYGLMAIGVIKDKKVFIVLSESGELTLKINGIKLDRKGMVLRKIEDNFNLIQRTIGKETSSYEEWEKSPLSKSPWYDSPKHVANLLFDYLCAKQENKDLDAKFDQLKNTFKMKFKNPQIRVTVDTPKEEKIKQAEYDTVAYLSTLWDRRKDGFNEKIVIDVKVCIEHLNFYKVPKSLWTFTPKQSND